MVLACIYECVLKTIPGLNVDKGYQVVKGTWAKKDGLAGMGGWVK